MALLAFSGMYRGLATFYFLVNVLDWEAKAQMGKKGVLSNHLRFRHGIVTLLTSSPMKPIPIAIARHSIFWPNIPHWGLFGIWISNYPFHKEDLMKKKNRKDTEMSPPKAYKLDHRIACYILAHSLFIERSSLITLTCRVSLPAIINDTRWYRVDEGFISRRRVLEKK